MLALLFGLLSVSFLHALGALTGALGGGYVVQILVVLLHAKKKIQKALPTCNRFSRVLNIPK